MIFKLHGHCHRCSQKARRDNARDDKREQNIDSFSYSLSFFPSIIAMMLSMKFRVKLLTSLCHVAFSTQYTNSVPLHFRNSCNSNIAASHQMIFAHTFTYPHGQTYCSHTSHIHTIGSTWWAKRTKTIKVLNVVLHPSLLIQFVHSYGAILQQVHKCWTILHLCFTCRNYNLPLRSTHAMSMLDHCIENIHMKILKSINIKKP